MNFVEQQLAILARDWREFEVAEARALVWREAPDALVEVFVAMQSEEPPSGFGRVPSYLATDAVFVDFTESLVESGSYSEDLAAMLDEQLLALLATDCAEFRPASHGKDAVQSRAGIDPRAYLALRAQVSWLRLEARRKQAYCIDKLLQQSPEELELWRFACDVCVDGARPGRSVPRSERAETTLADLVILHLALCESRICFLRSHESLCGHQAHMGSLHGGGCWQQGLEEALCAGEDQMSKSNSNPIARVLEPRIPSSIDLPSGRRVDIVVDGDEERLLVRGREGELQLELRFDENGPLLQLRGARVELQASRSLILRGDDVTIVAANSTTIQCGRRLQVDGGRGSVRMSGDLDLQGRSIHLNS